MRRAVLCLTTILLAAVTSPSVAHAMSVTGFARVLDGDTADIGGKRVRFFGIDAPELSQSCVDANGTSWQCGKASRDRLEELTAGKTVTCTYEEADATGRLLGSCKADSRDINGTLVSEGHAWAFVRYSDTYVETERKARAARKGIFAAENVPAWEYRAKRWDRSHPQRTAGPPTARSRGT
jgi:endonuclease YncB( thermonuclease family)